MSTPGEGQRENLAIMCDDQALNWDDNAEQSRSEGEEYSGDQAEAARWRQIAAIVRASTERVEGTRIEGWALQDRDEWLFSLVQLHDIDERATLIIHNAGASVTELASERDPEQSYYLDGPWEGSNVGTAYASKQRGPAVLVRYGWQQFGAFVCDSRPGREGACRLTFDRTPEGDYKLQDDASLRAGADVEGPVTCGATQAGFDSLPCLETRGHEGQHLDVTGERWDVEGPSESATWGSVLVCGCVTRGYVLEKPCAAHSTSPSAPAEPLEAAVRAFLAKYDEVEPHTIGVFQVAQLHVGPYRGPSYEHELKALRAALSVSTSTSYRACCSAPDYGSTGPRLHYEGCPEETARILASAPKETSEPRRESHEIQVGGPSGTCRECGEPRNDAREVHVCFAERDYLARKMAEIKARRVTPEPAEPREETKT